VSHLWLDKQTIRSVLCGSGTSALQGHSNPLLATVSGVATTKAPLITYVDRHVGSVEVITTKSFQVTVNPGNREPIICEIEAGSFGNSVGLRNPGMEEALSELRLLRSKGLRCLLNVSISASNAEDFVTLAGAFQSVADILELNFSCPHAASGYGSSIGCDPAITAMYVKAIKDAFPDCQALIFPKLTPNVEDIGIIAKAAVDAGADGISAINTVGPVVYREPLGNQIILQNKLGGKGGKSGRWIKQHALGAVKRIREAVGPGIPIIGMGGITDASDIVDMLKAGADVVGIGSAFGKVPQVHWDSYTKALLSDFRVIITGKEDPRSCYTYYQDYPTMHYEEHRVVSVSMHDKDTAVIVLDGKKPFEAGQFVFLWIPEVGEKPFSIALSDPLTFVVKRRGPFTDALLNLQPHNRIYLRGLYGKPVQLAKTERAVLIAGGTGVAVLPALARRLHEQHTNIVTFIGTSSAAAGPMEEELRAFGPVTSISDDGIPARVLDFVLSELERSESTAVYIVGPEKFMAKAARIARSASIDPCNIFLSMELSTMCGIGMCGECVCGDRLTCQWGTFLSYDYLEREAPVLL